MNDDDNLSRRIRAADPASAPLDYGSSSRGIEIHDRILARATGAAATRRRGERRRGWFIGARPLAAASLIVALVVAVSFLQPRAVFANTPPALDLVPTESTLSAVVGDCIARLDSGSSAEQSSRFSSYEGWYLQVTIDDDDTVAPVIVPEEQTFDWTAELGGTVTTTAGEAYTVRDGDVIPPASDAPANGEVLQSVVYDEGTVPVVFSDAPPRDVNGMRAYLAMAYGIDDTADDVVYIDAIRGLLNEWSLTNSQHAILLKLVEQLDGVSVAGDVVDRLGRAGTALRIAPPEGQYYERLLILSRDTGRIIGLESVYVGGSPDIDLPVSSVVEYVAWR